MNSEFWLSMRQIPLIANYLTLVTVHGNLCLALRHPDNKGASRQLAVEFTKQLGEWLVKVGALTPAQLVEAQQLEAAEGSKDLL